MNDHMDLMKDHHQALKHIKSQMGKVPSLGNATAGAGMAKAACLGVIRLDYDYPPAPGDIDCPDSFNYDVYYRVVPGLTFSMCQSGKLTSDVRMEFLEAVDWLE